MGEERQAAVYGRPLRNLWQKPRQGHICSAGILRLMNGGLLAVAASTGARPSARYDTQHAEAWGEAVAMAVAQALSSLWEKEGAD